MFNGSLRDKSSEYGYLVPLCGESCHRLGKKAVHQCRETADKIKEHFQIVHMIENCASIADFRHEFYKNYIGPEYYEDEREFEMDINLVVIGGKLTRDPVLFETKDGKKVAHFRIANTVSKDSTNYVECESWGREAEFVAANFSKGKRILVNGGLKHNDYKDDGSTKNNYVIVAKNVFFGDSKRYYNTDQELENSTAEYVKTEPSYSELDDVELPFDVFDFPDGK